MGDNLEVHLLSVLPVKIPGTSDERTAKDHALASSLLSLLSLLGAVNIHYFCLFVVLSSPFCMVIFNWYMYCYLWGHVEF